jgi:DNA-binding MarR family transcriptional regulator
MLVDLAAYQAIIDGAGFVAVVVALWRAHLALSDRLYAMTERVASEIAAQRQIAERVAVELARLSQSLDRLERR